MLGSGAILVAGSIEKDEYVGLGTGQADSAYLCVFRLQEEHIGRLTGAGMDRVTIQILTREGAQMPATITIEYGRLRVLHYEGPGLKSPARFEGVDAWDVFLQMRQALDAIGMTPLCVGAMPNAVHSGMSRDMSDGLRIYVTPGMEVRGIFEPVQPGEVGTLDAQSAYRRQWWNSPPTKSPS